MTNLSKSKVLTLRVNEQEQKILSRALTSLRTFRLSKDPLAEELSTADAIKELFRTYTPPKSGKEIPYFKVTKNEIADFLGISQLDKRWGTFMDNIEKYYYE